MLNGAEILRLIRKIGLIKNYISLKDQIQPSSFDLTLDGVFSFSSPGKIDFDNKDRKISDVKEIKFKNGFIFLKPGGYKIRYNETIKLPKNLAGLTIPRSSLARCGCNIHNGFWDPGYCGRGETLLLVHNPKGIHLKKNAKIAQMIFLKMNEAEKVYAGIHQNENI